MAFLRRVYVNFSVAMCKCKPSHGLNRVYKCMCVCLCVCGCVWVGVCVSLQANKAGVSSQEFYLCRVVMSRSVFAFEAPTGVFF